MKVNLKANSVKTIASVLLVAFVAGLGMGFATEVNQVPAKKTTITYPELRTASNLSRFLQNVSGLTPVSAWLANRILRRELAEHIDGKLRSKLKLYSATDLLGGKARQIAISGENLLLAEFIPVSRFQFENIREMPLYVSKDRRPILLRPVVFKINLVLSEADINRMLASEKGRKYLTDMRASIPPFGAHSFDALEPRLDIDEGTITLKTMMNLHNAPPENALPVTVSGAIATKKSALILSDLKLDVDGMADVQAIARIVEDYFGELVDFRKLKVQRHRVSIVFDQSELKDEQLKLSARVTVAPEPKALKKALGKAGL